MTAEEAITSFGRLPLPPYVSRDPDESDEDRYQTVYADREGSVAAPTAGLHFTTPMLAALRARRAARHASTSRWDRARSSRWSRSGSANTSCIRNDSRSRRIWPRR